MKVSTDEQKIKHLLTHSVEEVFVRESLEKKLRSGKQLRVKLGFDPTSPFLHIGRAIVLWKLREFQELGHKVVFIVGDTTALIGDPSDKLEKRPMLTTKKIKDNLKNYRAQVGKILDLKKAEFHFNSKWLKKLNFNEIIELAECFSLQQMSHRRNFADRIEKGEEISLRELLYPLMQGYDSVAVKADVEIGGFDQLFNLKAGRIIQKHYGQTEQDIINCQMLEGTDGRKMSSSWGNVINLLDEPTDMYGKVMAVRDDLIVKYFTLCTRLSDEEINNIKKTVEEGGNPRDAKMRLGKEIVSLYHGEKKAKEAEENFIKTFQKGGVSEDATVVTIKKEELLVDVLLKEKIISSKNEWRRLVEENAIFNMDTNEKITDQYFKVVNPITLRVGKRRFVKINTKK
ncbi:MAG: tyrosine--tRNA ligase [Candidatus Paceibacterota bacterium]|jgi:tyrosyl-tRNA synthetase